VSIVLDGSMALAWCFEDESTPAIDAIMLQVANASAVAPSHFTTFDVRIDAESDTHIWAATVQLAAHYGLTVYDAAYPELAQRRRMSLATLDKALGRAAKQAGGRGYFGSTLRVSAPVI
jgi:hypothetical protein